MKTNDIEYQTFDNIKRIINSDRFKSDLIEIESFIKNNYERLHKMWGIKNKVKLAAERLVRFHIWRNFSAVDLYKTPLSSDVAFELSDCVLNIDCKTVDIIGNNADIKNIQFEPNQANFYNKKLYGCEIPGTKETFEGYEFIPRLSKFYKRLPVLSYFIFINYKDSGYDFSLDGLELCCLPHNDVVKEFFDANIITGCKTYDYMKKLQAEKFDDYFIPIEKPRDHWIEFYTTARGRTTKRYYDNKNIE